jgi:hypothetical protein
MAWIIAALFMLPTALEVALYVVPLLMFLAAILWNIPRVTRAILRLANEGSR